MPDPALVPARLVRGARGAVVAPHHLATAAGLAVLARGRARGRRGHRHERRAGRGHAQRLRDRRRRVLAGVGRGGRRAGRPQRIRALAGRRGRRGAARAGPGPDPAARTARHHDPGRGPLLGRCPPPLGPALPRRGAGGGDRARGGRVPGVGRAGERRGGDGREPGPGAVDGRVPQRLATRGAPVAARRADPAPRAGCDAAHAGRRGLRRLLRRRPRRADRARAAGGRRRACRGRPARAPQHLGLADRHHVPGRPGHDAPAQQQRRARPRDPQRPRAVRAPAGCPLHGSRLVRRRLAAPPARGRQARLRRPRPAAHRSRVPRRPGGAAPLAGACVGPGRPDRPVPRRPCAAPGSHPGGRHDLAGRRGRRGQRRQPHPVERGGLRVRGPGPGDRRALPEPWRVVLAGPVPPQRPRAAQADGPHPAARDAVPRGRAAPVDRRRVHGRRHPAPDPRPARVRAGRRRGGHRDRRRRAADHGRAGRLARAAGARAHGRRARRTAWRRGCSSAATAWGTSRTTAAWATSTPSSWSTADRRRAGPWPRRRIPGARGCRPFGEPWAGGDRPGAPAAGWYPPPAGGSRAHTDLPPAPCGQRRRP